MHYVTTAIGRTVPEGDAGIVLKDLVLKILFDYAMSPFNSGNDPMTLSDLARIARVDSQTARQTAESLSEGMPQLVQRVQGEIPSYRITSSGGIFVQNTPQSWSDPR